MGLFWNTLQVLLIASSVCYAQRTIPKSATAFCVKKPDGQQFTMRFSLVLGSGHPAGELIPIQTGLESRKLTSCSYTVSGNLYLATFDYDIVANANTVDFDKCGMVRGLDGGIETYTWRIAFVEEKNILNDRLMYDDLDRIYEFTCYEAQLTEVMKSTAINVDAPNLNQQVPIIDLDIQFRVYKQRFPVPNSGGIYDVADPTTGVQAGYWIYLELELNLPADFTLSTHPHGIFAFNTIVSGSSTFSPFWRIFDEITGCTSVASPTVSVMPFNPTSFVRDTTKTNVGANGRWVLRTGPFRALKFEGSDTMNFMTNFGTCFGAVDNNGRCAQSCLSKRRKRSIEEPKEARAHIRVLDGDEKYHVGKSDSTTAEASSSMTALIIGLIVVGVLTLLTSTLLTAVCLMRRRRGKQAERNYNHFSNPPPVVVPTEKQ